MADQIISSPSFKDEIDLLIIAKTLWKGRSLVVKSILIFGVIGFLVAITAPKEYEASTIMVPSGNISASNLGGLGGLAAMAGINLSSPSGADLSPTLYPKIVTSIPYLLELMKTPLNFEGYKDSVSFYDYCTHIQEPNPLFKYTIGLPRVILGFLGTMIESIRGHATEKEPSFKLLRPLELTSKQQSVIETLSGMINLNSNVKEGFLTLTAKMAEPRAAAQLGQRAQELLQQYIIEFKIKKAKANLDFIQQRFDETTKKFEDIQQRLALFNDRNKNVSLASAKTEEVRLTSQYNLIFSIYTELAKQLEQAKIQVKQDTPVFTIIEPITVPTTRSKPQRSKIVMIWLFLGAVLGTVIVFGEELISPLKKKWRD